MQTKTLVVLLGMLLVALALPAASLAQPSNDNFANATEIGSLPFDETVNNSDATIEDNEPFPCQAVNTVWYKYTATASGTMIADQSGSGFSDTRLSLYRQTGPTISDLEFLGCSFSDDGIAFGVQAGQTYYLQAGAVSSAGGNLRLYLYGYFSPPPGPPPPNDDIANATVISALPYADSLDTTGATSDPGDPTDCTNNGTVWYVFNPVSDMLVQANTFGSSYDTQMAVYSGSPGALTLLDCNDDYSDVQSRVQFNAQSGTTYYVLVGACCGAGGQTGGGALSFAMGESAPPPSPPSNDDYAHPVVIPSAPLPFNYINSENTAGATPDADVPCVYQRAVWYSFTPTVDTLITANSMGSDYETILGVLMGSPGSFNPVADCVYGSGNSVTFKALAGTTYSLVIGQWYGAGENLTFNVKGEEPFRITLTIDSGGTVTSKTGVAKIHGTLTCNRSAHANLTAELRQKVGRLKTISGSGSVELNCSGETKWSMEIVPVSGAFAGGAARASVSANVCVSAGGECVNGQQTTTVKLKGGK